MPSLKVVYFPFPGRAEPTRLVLTLGGHSFEDEKLTMEQWGTTLKPKVDPRQLPLLHVDGECIGQSMAIARYAAKISSLDGKPLYPTDPLAALRVDEFCDTVNELFPPLMPTFAIADQAAKEAARAALVAEDGPMTKWLKHIDGMLGKSSSGFAVGDSLTLADIVAFAGMQPFKTGFLDGMPKDCLDQYKHICAHAAKVAAIPQVKEYYKNAEGPFSAFKQ